MSDPANSLALDPDCGDIDAAEALEAAFGIELPDAEVQELQTVGELYELILKKVRLQPGPCGTSMAFYRLRRALQPEEQLKLSVDAPLKPLQRGGARALRDQLVSATGLELPAMAPTAIGLFGYGLWLGAFCASVVALFHWNLILGLWAISGIALGSLLLRFDPQRLPARVQTLGQLAQATAATSFKKLSESGAGATEASVWEALTFVLTQHSDLPRENMARETTFFPQA